MPVRKRKLPYSQRPEKQVSSGNNLTVVHPPAVIIELPQKKQEEILVDEVVLVTEDPVITEPVIEAVETSSYTGYRFGDNPVKGKGYGDGFPMKANIRTISGSKNAIGEEW